MSKHKLYLLNAPIVPIAVDTKCVVHVTRVKNVEYVRKFIEIMRRLGYEVVSAIGHESTAKVLSMLLGFEVPAQRLTITLTESDLAVAFALDIRVSEGKVLTKEELDQLVKENKVSFYIIEVIRCVGKDVVELHVID
jgi:hypothetical protein